MLAIPGLTASSMYHPEVTLTVGQVHVPNVEFSPYAMGSATTLSRLDVVGCELWRAVLAAMRSTRSTERPA